MDFYYDFLNPHWDKIRENDRIINEALEKGDIPRTIKSMDEENFIILASLVRLRSIISTLKDKECMFEEYPPVRKLIFSMKALYEQKYLSLEDLRKLQLEKGLTYLAGDN